MPVLEDRLLSLGAKNSTVYAFEQLVNNCIGVNSSTSQNRSNNTLPVRRIAELTQELYDKAAGLPEAQSVSFKYLDSASKFQYGNFKGGNTYKTFSGDVDSNNKNAKPQQGWIIIDRSSSEYCLFTNNGKSLIIAIADFEPTPIIEDFTPLYEKLCQQKYSGSNAGLHTDDIRSAYALAVTFRLDISDLLNNKLYQAWLIFMNAYRLVGEFSLLIKKLKGEKTKNIERITGLYYQDDSLAFNQGYNSDQNFFGIYPKQIEWLHDFHRRDSAYNEVQAIIYDLPGGGNSSSPAWSLNEPHMEQLLCYQQPESISYTSSAGFEAVTARGTQQPFQFYTNANEIRLSFTLAWHIDELRTFKNEEGWHYSLQDVANIAENFTRPWESGESLTPKLCKVILPGISEIGYITQAQIEYSGDMTGDGLNDFAGLLSDNASGSNNTTEENSVNNSSFKYSSVTNYHYTEIKVAFELLIVKDVKLFSEESAKANTNNTWTIEADNLKPHRASALESSSNESDEFSIDSLVSTVREVTAGAATVSTAIGGMADALSQMNSAAISLIS